MSPVGSSSPPSASSSLLLSFWMSMLPAAKLRLLLLHLRSWFTFGMDHRSGSRPKNSVRTRRLLCVGGRAGGFLIYTKRHAGNVVSATRRWSFYSLFSQEKVSDRVLGLLPPPAAGNLPCQHVSQLIIVCASFISCLQNKSLFVLTVQGSPLHTKTPDLLYNKENYTTSYLIPDYSSSESL